MVIPLGPHWFTPSEGPKGFVNSLRNWTMKSNHEKGHPPWSDFMVHDLSWPWRWYSMWLTVWSYTLLYLFTIEVFFDGVKLLMFYNVQTTKLTFVGKIWDYLGFKYIWIYAWILVDSTTNMTYTTSQNDTNMVVDERGIQTLKVVVVVLLLLMLSFNVSVPTSAHSLLFLDKCFV